MQFRIRLYTSMRIWILGAKPMRIRILPDFAVTKSGILTWKIYFMLGNRSHNILTKLQKPFWKTGNQFYLLFLVSCLAPGSGNVPIRIRIQRFKSIRILSKRDTACYRWWTTWAWGWCPPAPRCTSSQQRESQVSSVGTVSSAEIILFFLTLILFLLARGREGVGFDSMHTCRYVRTFT
jgi:hypothetical protein